MFSKLVNILNTKGNKSNLSYSVIVAPVCHQTSMTRRHGNGQLKKLTLGGQLEYLKLTSERINEVLETLAQKHYFYY